MLFGMRRTKQEEEKITNNICVFLPNNQHIEIEWRLVQKLKMAGEMIF